MYKQLLLFIPFRMIIIKALKMLNHFLKLVRRIREEIDIPNLLHIQLLEIWIRFETPPDLYNTCVFKIVHFLWLTDLRIKTAALTT